MHFNSSLTFNPSSLMLYISSNSSTLQSSILFSITSFTVKLILTLCHISLRLQSRLSPQYSYQFHTHSAANLLGKFICYSLAQFWHSWGCTGFPHPVILHAILSQCVYSIFPRVSIVPKLKTLGLCISTNLQVCHYSKVYGWSSTSYLLHNCSWTFWFFFSWFSTIW